MPGYPLIGVFVAYHTAPDDFTCMCQAKNEGAESLNWARRMGLTYAAMRGNTGVEIRAFGRVKGEYRRLAVLPVHPGETPGGFVRLTWFDAPSEQDGPLGPNARKVGGYHYALWNRSGSRIMGGTLAPGLPSAVAYVLKLATERGLDPEIETLDPRGEAAIFDDGAEACRIGLAWYKNPFASGSAQAAQWDAGHTRQRTANPA